MDLYYKIQYKKGITNAAADALSWCPGNEVIAVSECIPSWVQKLKAGYEEYPEDKQLLSELSIASHNDKGYTLADGII